MGLSEMASWYYVTEMFDKGHVARRNEHRGWKTVDEHKIKDLGYKCTLSLALLPTKLSFNELAVRCHVPETSSSAESAKADKPGPAC